MIFVKILIYAAVIPALLLLKYVYKMDRLEKESMPFLLRLVIAGIISTFIALVFETVGQFILGIFFHEQSPAYRILMYFIVVGVSEEGGKYFVLNRRTWNNPEFNCTFDGVVYAVFVSMGFALWENIKYVLSYGFGTAVIRAITAVPGHACFGVFMGFWYGIAKRCEIMGYESRSRHYRKLSVIVPVIIHGLYDFIATDGTERGALLFIAFVMLMFLICYRLINKLSKDDKYLDQL